ncbi:FAD-binding and (Fe-S)-binding domain-containing protein [Cryobacterium ruanii]|uniref:FAD-binding oxidoreductase n=1 Tax=Cryobacterium ruanii TaxID=1259197 RepID=A0A4R9ALT6_9MICO|nr:FAD-binding and (Fe-S)-binding domain-containing protein [Cryobacterium ruanii]TFD65329.1 FAD-binding oxidoreductase [Cryobacterium ruanii]
MPSTPLTLASDRFHPLRAGGIEVDTAPRRLSEYSYDASNYRVSPVAVVFPRSVDEVVAVARFASAEHIPLVSRGGGTSMAGNAVGAGIVLDFSRYLHAIHSIDLTAQTAVVDSGVILSTLQREVAAVSGGTLTFAPDPSSRTRATIGGAIGNDACGNHSVRHGRTSDHVLALDLVTAAGIRLTATRTALTATDETDAAARALAATLTAGLRQLAADHLGEFRLELGRIARQVSGYHLSHLLPEHGFDVARALVGSEGTCAIVVAATVQLVPQPQAALLLSLGYDDVVDAARDVPTILEFSPAAIEGIDEAIVQTMQARRGADSVQGLPAGKAWLYVDIDGDDPVAVAAQGEKLLARLRENGRLLAGRAVPDLAERASLWRVREDGAGLSARLASGGESWPGWEDSAVAPKKLADYLEDFRRLMAQFDLTGVIYGHFGAGCMHVRLTFDLRSASGRQIMDDFTRAAAELVVRHGGSISGEHGDGRSRSAMLPIMYSPAMMAAFARFKALWDPQQLLNPGSIVDPEPTLAHLTLAETPNRVWRTSFDLTPVGQHGSNSGLDSFSHAVQGCVGIGRCRSDVGGVMCPSYRATGDEKDSTRGRARVLQDMIRGARTVKEGWRSEEVREALDLCLSCKACSSDCPAGVDMATYKSEFFDNYYEGRLRPISHYSLGWLPRWLKLTGLMAPLVNLVLGSTLGTLIARLGGVTTQRRLPHFHAASAWKKMLPPTTSTAPADVVLFIDTFTRGFRPDVAGSAQRVLQSAGKTVECSAEVCCGLTWISTGQLSTARRLLRNAAQVLDDGTDRLIVVLEPSCAAALRKDLPELVPTDAARRVSQRIRSFAGAVTELAADGWRPDWAGGQAPASVTVQAHCHEYSVFGANAQKAALTAVGVGEVREATGCCGVAGNFGFEQAHFDLSMIVAEQALAPALRALPPQQAVLTDGFSCHMQVQQLDPARQTHHLAQLLDPTRLPKDTK